ncbi:hypothetical protein [Fibrobacter sp. UWEL]|uniref:hypothetical protein n=1 Tax=Fibrobacter sp. UWEL TaxID=1896209 RepID=UPI00090F6D8B|nr:hypothetical protein [Fibrobacter sp. UWEL]SHL32306.1 hypothetical protein SAMN05720468_1229 [Fibrobacter sp. UWEL]
MMGISQQQELDAMPDGMAKRILLKVINAPKADLAKLDEMCKDLEKQYLESHHMTEFPR